MAPAAGAALDTATMMQVRDGLVAQGHATREEIERHLDTLAAGRLDVTMPPLVSAWGRRSGRDDARARIDSTRSQEVHQMNMGR